jgi:hypothetical protein
MIIKRRLGGAGKSNRVTWVVDYHNQAGKRRRKTFKHRRDAKAFSDTTRILNEGTAFADDEKLDFTIHQAELYGLKANPLTVRMIIRQIGKIWRAATRLGASELAFLVEFAGDSDRGGFVENSFLDAALSAGAVKTYTYRRKAEDGGEDEELGEINLHRFFDMYVVNSVHWGEGDDTFGPFANKKDGKEAFYAEITNNTLGQEVCGRET